MYDITNLKLRDTLNFTDKKSIKKNMNEGGNCLSQ